VPSAPDPPSPPETPEPPPFSPKRYGRFGRRSRAHPLQFFPSRAPGPRRPPRGRSVVCRPQPPSASVPVAPRHGGRGRPGDGPVDRRLGGSGMAA